MRSIPLYALLVLFNTILLSCAEEGIMSYRLTPGKAVDLTLQPGERVQLQPAGVTVEFARVSEESRCPEGAMCTWPGRGVIDLRLNPDHSSPSTIQLHIPGMVQTPFEGGGLDTLGYRWMLRQLNPYPRVSDQPGSITYEAVLRIQKLN